MLSDNNSTSRRPQESYLRGYPFKYLQKKNYIMNTITSRVRKHTYAVFIYLFTVLVINSYVGNYTVCGLQSKVLCQKHELVHFPFIYIRCPPRPQKLCISNLKGIVS